MMLMFIKIYENIILNLKNSQKFKQNNFNCMKEFAIVSAVFILIFCNIVYAKFISLTTTISEIEIENKTQANLTVANYGDEAAFSVSISLILPEGFDSNKIFINKLEPNYPIESTLNITRNKDLLPGRYPAIVLTEYTDANSYPFSAISYTSIIYKVNTFSKVSGSMKELSLAGKSSKKLILELKNFDESEHELKIRLFLPKELKVSEKEKTILIKGKEERKIEFDVSNFGALEGSSYFVLASIEYEDNLHYSSFATGIIKIEKENKGFLPNRYLICFLISFVVIYLCYVFYKKIFKNKSAKPQIYL